jgi:peptide deformylase
MIKKMCYIGEKILREKCRPVKEINDEVLRIAEELVQTMQAHNGLGLAAPQIGYNLRMFAIQISDEVDEENYPKDKPPEVFINPVITRFSKEKVLMTEGCLSIPGLHEEVLRPHIIDFEALDLFGNRVVELGLKNWRGRCIQHEYDHLEGVLFIDRFPQKLKLKHHLELKNIEEKFKKSSSNL